MTFYVIRERTLSIISLNADVVWLQGDGVFPFDFFSQRRLEDETYSYGSGAYT